MPLEYVFGLDSFVSLFVRYARPCETNWAFYELLCSWELSEAAARLQIACASSFAGGF
jgi:hypothetical protein